MSPQTKEMLNLYSKANEHDKTLILKTLYLFTKDPQSLDFAINWQGSGADLKAALMKVCQDVELPEIA